MAIAQLGAVVRHIRQLADAGQGRELTDAALLRAFLGRNDQTAFEALLLRHGPMVLRVCQRALGNAHDAEDVLQATFLVLARRAASVRKRESLASWLHGVAYRMTKHARRAVVRRSRHESQASPARPPDPALCAAWQEIQVLLDAEIAGLPETLRGAFVLCCLENKSSAEAARQLRLNEGTVRKRLSRAREFLQERLTRRGVSLAAVLAAAAVGAEGAPAAVSRSLFSSTAQAATQMAAGQAVTAGLVSTEAAALTKGALKIMFLTKLKTAAGVVLAVVLAGTGAGALAYSAMAGQPGGAPASQAPADDAARIAKLVEQLGSDSFAEREAAEKEVDKIGGPALDALRKAAKGDDPERGRRAAELARKIERRAVTADLLAAKRVRLVYKDTPLADAVADFRKQSSYELSLSDPGGRLKGRTVTLDTGEVTFWRALDLFCRAAGLTDRPAPAPGSDSGAAYPPPQGSRPGDGAGQGGILLADGKAAPVPADDSTAVRVRTSEAVRIANGDEIHFTVQITPEPKLRGATIAGVRIKKAVDNTGQSLEPVSGGNDAAAPPVGVRPSAPGFPAPPSPAAPERSNPAAVHLKGGTTTATSFELSGTITIRVPQEPGVATQVVTLDVPFALKNVTLP